MCKSCRLERVRAEIERLDKLSRLEALRTPQSRRLQTLIVRERQLSAPKQERYLLF